jgi:hypothetical protein
MSKMTYIFKIVKTTFEDNQIWTLVMLLNWTNQKPYNHNNQHKKPIKEWWPKPSQGRQKGGGQRKAKSCIARKAQKKGES